MEIFIWINIQLQHDNHPIPPILRERDKFMTEWIIELGYKLTQMKQLRRYRLSNRCYILADMVSEDGKCLGKDITNPSVKAQEIKYKWTTEISCQSEWEL